MARRTIVKIGEDILRKRAKEVTVFDNGLAALLDDMIETMTAADGVGLAGPQVGVLKRVAVISPDGKNFYEFVNPVIEKSSGMQKCREGCLSVPGVSGEVMRPKKWSSEPMTDTETNSFSARKAFLPISAAMNSIILTAFCS